MPYENYEIKESIGNGGCGEVFKCIRKVDGMPFVIKRALEKKIKGIRFVNDQAVYPIFIFINQLI